MSERSIKTSRPLSAMLLGLLATLAVAAGYLCEWDSRPELHALDLRLNYFPPATRCDRIVHVFIDDNSLQEIGQWPWPNRRIAGLLDSLEEAGAGSVVLDILFADPQATRFDAPNLDVNSPQAQLVGAQPRLIFDDLALADTLAGHRNLFLAMHVEDRPEPSLVEQALHKVLLSHTMYDLDQAANEIHQDPASVRFEFRWAQEQAIADRTRQVLRQRPQTDFESLWPLVLDGAESGRQTRQMDLVRQAYLRERALTELARHAIDVRVDASLALPGGRIIPPLVQFTQAVSHVGFADFTPDADGTARRVRLLRQVEGKVYPQLAFAAALRELEREHGSLEILADPAALTIRCRDGAQRRIPLDDSGAMLVRPIPRAGFAQLSAASVDAVWRERQSLERNRRLSRLLHLELADRLAQFRLDAPPAQAEAVQWKLVDLRDEIHKLYAQADQIDRALQDYQVRRQRTMLFDPAHVPPADTALARQDKQVEQQIEDACRRLRQTLRPIRLVGPTLATTRPADAARVREEYEKEKQLYDHVTAVRAMVDKLEAERPVLTERAQSVLAWLRQQVEGRTVFLGSSATSAADFAPTPLGPRTPGVVVQANAMNTILEGRFIAQAPVKLNLLAILLAGAAISLLAAMFPVWATLPAAGLLGMAYAGFNASVVFARWDTHLVVAAPLAAIVAAFLAVTAYRQLTEERAKREIRAMFAQALSPALVDRLIEDPKLARLGGERRVLSCFFSDLAGFTTLSERLGEQATVRLLNRYFDRMTEVIQGRSGGYLNKFLGDGLFVFFGAPVFQDDHAKRAVQAAVLCQIEVASLNAALARELKDPPRLTCRIGIATGDVMVGNCGSSQRMDYTAIGDAVNLASRLEGADKFFGTRILVSQSTWEAAGCDSACGRLMGEILVVGKNEPVAVWSVLHELPADDQADAVKAAFAQFTRGVELYRERQFTGAAEQFEQFLQTFPADKAATTYLKWCAQHQANPPGADWSAVVKLTEK